MLYRLHQQSKKIRFETAKNNFMNKEKQQFASQAMNFPYFVI